MESLDFLYQLKDCEGFDGRPAPPPPDPLFHAPSWWDLSIAVAAVLLIVALFSIGRDLRREQIAPAAVAARN